MRINQKVRYGVACLYELSKEPEGFTDANLIARRQDIPPAYAQKVLQLMAQANLVQGMKGAGYKLSVPLENITVLKVMEVLSAESITEETPRKSSIVIEQKIKQALGSISLSCLGQGAANIS